MKKIQNICDVESCFLCKNCLKEWRPAISAHKINFKVKKGEVIFKEGDPVTGIYFVYSGNVKVYKKWDKDKELIVRFAKAGSIFGHRGLGIGSAYPISAAALESTVVCYVDVVFFEASLKVNPDFTHKLLMFFMEELKQSERKMRNLAHMSVKGRVAEALISLQGQFGLTPDGFIGIDLSRQDLASYAGATYETVFRMMNELVSEQLISLSGKSIRIANYDELSKLAQDPFFP
ncbi:Crp/Fnr family transcriptional regulator [Mucilaginibacter sabulilitoris]|uniref:Crp/Fnr family transcriptional regulator n=1 Tax=Mucilaginibacter sabulilitoris TaxID=1173583 RepID=A0ABZ0TJL7_9SPHI|nr:Crp/Fnr family transcriptional regulator [Mucilaginibacter sabulilitoris]WPU93238.1 Crp/Fnr family transcriptional regulator [Mucilaginibacter sabulilitoris]